jgi:hypothetical protein
MILKAKIRKEFVDQILAGKKTCEFRQFDGKDRMEVTDEFGHTTMLRIVRAYEAQPDYEEAIKKVHNTINWDHTEPIIVFAVEPLADARRH